MKYLQKYNLKIATNSETEMSLLRKKEFEKSVGMLIFKINSQDWLTMFKEFTEAVEVDKTIILTNFLQGLLIQKDNFDAYLECFKWICYEDNEPIYEIDNLFLNEKLKRIDKLGITEDEIKFEVDSFTEAFPALKVHKMRMLEMRNSIK